MSRREVIRQVEQAVMSDRNQDYAPPEQNFQRIADLWNVYLEGKTEVTPYDTSMMMVLVKVARSMASPHLIDHLVDIAGYAACAADVMPPSPDATEAVPATAKVSVATDGGLPGDVAAVYEGVEGFIRNGIWHGTTGRKIIVRDIDMAVREGVLVVS
tara:strand:- start:524 stop:994 length:471 start_codon:yes stop_codon:yes gene_type:complete